MISGALSAALLWLAAASPEAALPAHDVLQAPEDNIYYVQVDGMT
jgi:hypothetical protein